MSAYTEIKTEMTDVKHIITAIETLGYGVVLRGEHDLQITRGESGSYMHGNVTRQADGTYRIHGDVDYLTPQFIGQVKQEYGVARTMAIAKQRGYQFGGREVVGNKVKLRFYQR